MISAARYFLLMSLIFISWADTAHTKSATTADKVSNATYTIVGIEPDINEGKVLIRLTPGINLGIKNFDNENTRGIISFFPPEDIDWYRSSIEEGNVINLEGEFTPGQTYRIKIPSESALVQDRQYAPSLNAFTMPDYPPSIDFALKKTTIERDSRQMVHVKLRNVKEILFESVKVPHFLALYEKDIYPVTVNQRIRPMEEAFVKVWKPLQGVMESREEFKPFVDKIHYQSHLFFNPSPKNNTVTFSIPLTFREEKEKGAALLTQLSSNETASGCHSPLSLFRVTNLCLAAKSSPARLMVWSTEIGSGKPVGGVDILAADLDHRLFVLGKTDQQGVLRIENKIVMDYIQVLPEATQGRAEFNINRLAGLVGSCPNDCTSLDLRSPGKPEKPYSNPPTLVDLKTHIPIQGTVFTERGVYRPGEKIYFKGAIREYRDRATRIPEGATCTVRIIDALDQEIYKRDYVLNEFGTFSDAIALESFAPLGKYRIQLFIGTLGDRECVETEESYYGDGKDRFLGGISFQVQEFRPPRHKVELSFREETRTSTQFVNHKKEEQVLVCKIAGKYFAGGPLKHGQVRWTVGASGADFPQADYPDYTFGYSISGFDYGFDGIIESGESILNESGEVEFRLPLGRDILAGKGGLKVSATVVDFDGIAATYTETFQKKPLNLIGINLDNSSLYSGDTSRVKVIVLDSQKKLIPEGEIEVRVLSHDSIHTLKRNDEGSTYSSWQTVWRGEYTNQAPIRNGSATIELEFNSSGSFMLEFLYRDPDGNESISGDVIYIGSYDDRWEYGERKDQEIPEGAIQLLADQNEYAVGDVMKLRIKTTEPVASCLVTIEQGSVLSYCLGEANGKPIEIPIRDDFRPNFRVSVIGIVPRGEFPAYLGEFDRDAPRIATTTRRVKVREQKDTIEVVIAPGVDKLKSTPAASMPIELLVKDSQGNGVESEVALAVVDERVLALTGFKTPMLDDLLKYELPLTVLTHDGHREILLQTPFGDLRNNPLTGGDGSRSRPEGVANLQIRKNFNPVPYFNPSIRTGADGKATVDISFSDTMTTYRIYAVACDKSSRFASAEKACLVNREFYIEPGIPRFLNRGDEIDFQVAAFNKTDQAGTIVFSVTGPAELELSTPSRSYAAKAQDRTLLPVKARALGVSQSPLLFKAALSDMQDAVQMDLPVQSGLPLQRDVQYARFQGKKVLDYQFPFDVSQLSQVNLSQKDLSVRLTLSSSPFLRLSGGLRYLLTYPYGCAEQTSSGIIPLASLRALIVDGLLPGISLDETDEFLKKGIDHLFSMQTDRGGFAYWPGQMMTSFEASLYAMTALVMAKQAGFAVNAVNLDRGLSYLMNQVSFSENTEEEDDEDEDDNDDDHDDEKGQGIYRALYILALEGKLTWQIFDKWWSNLDDESLHSESRLFAILAAHHAKLRSKEELAERTLGELMFVKMKKEKKAEIADLEFAPLMRGEAVELLACTQIFGTTSDIHSESVAASLISQMKSDGRWTSTSDTGWVLYALGKYYMGMKLSDQPIQGKILQAGLADRTFSLEAQASASFELDAREFLKNPKVEIQTDSNATTLAELALVYPRMDFSREGASQGIALSKQIENTAGTEDIHLGDVLKVTLILEIPTTRIRQIALDDPLPAGMTAINSALAIDDTGVSKSEHGEEYYQYWDPDGFYRLMPTHYEFRDDRVLVFRDSLWKGAYRYTYYARAVCAGKFRMPATRVQMMYDPEVFAYTAESEIVIKPR